EKPVPGVTREVAYGGAREAIRNAARHARGDVPNRPLELDVVVQSDDGLRLIVTDDGVGFSASPTEGGTYGSGLVLHSTMMAVVGGSLEVESKPGCGTRVVIAVPTH